MKTTRKLLIISLMLSFLIGCMDDLEYVPINQLTTERILGEPELLINATNGNYAFIKNNDRFRFEILEFMSDDVQMMRWSSNHLSYTLTYLHITNSDRSRFAWQRGYHAIYSINVVLEGIADDAQPEFLNLKGENFFLRALIMHDLVRIFGRPYSHDSPGTNLGVMLKETADVYDEPPRSSVKETFEFIERDLLKAAEFMTINKSAAWASKETAWALLARIYLYMEQNQKAIEYADKVINSGKYQLVSTEALPNYWRLTPENNSETIFAIKRESYENSGRSSVGTMGNGNGGWGEIMLTKPFLDLIFKNPNDQRIKYIEPQFALDSEGNKIPDSDNPYYGFRTTDRMGTPTYWNLKQTLQEDQPMGHSAIVLRLAEMYLIKAEAYAKLGQDQLALDNVNIIRERAGLSGDQLFTQGDLKGYPTVLDIVLDERRLELFWEGHRSYDLFRNKRGVDRRYKAWQGWSGPSYIPWTSNRIVHYIPETEIIRQPNLIQNPDMEPVESMPMAPPGD